MLLSIRTCLLTAARVSLHSVCCPMHLMSYPCTLLVNADEQEPNCCRLFRRG